MSTTIRRPRGRQGSCRAALQWAALTFAAAYACLIAYQSGRRPGGALLSVSGPPSAHALQALVDRQASFCAGLATLEILPKTLEWKKQAGDEIKEATDDTFGLERYVLRMDHTLGHRNVTAYAHQGTDIVSQVVRSGTPWEQEDVGVLLDQLASFAREKGLRHQEVFFLDVGANIGTFSLLVAAYGFSVLAFEPMRANQVALRLSACANPGLAERLHLVEKGLGDKEQHCIIYTRPHNVGDGSVICGDEKPYDDGYSKRGELDVSTLDAVTAGMLPQLRGRIGAIKMDIEGSELRVFLGGREFFRALRPPLLLVEVNKPQMQNYGLTTQGLFEQADELGYSIHREKLSTLAIARSDFGTYDPGAVHNVWMQLKA